MRGKPVPAQIPRARPGITPAHAGKTRRRGAGAPGSRDHPRACGENLYLQGIFQNFAGSPPRMRGKLLIAPRLPALVRITPAHAGKTRRTDSPRRKQRDHPRACGENCQALLQIIGIVGSPPRMRGKQDPQLPLRLISGITPAHAGKTLLCSSRADTLRDHPRACGENASRPLPERTVSGSPPRMRGKRVCAGIRCRASGITPAHAGKTPSAPSHPPPGGDHPRACGENPGLTLAVCELLGSPPRMRGKHLLCPEMDLLVRITPAHAGKTTYEHPAKQEARDHPRACGENRLTTSIPRSSAGSPPRMRGKPATRIFGRQKNGITPAHAGKTDLDFEDDRARRDHPRACGENNTGGVT